MYENVPYLPGIDFPASQRKIADKIRESKYSVKQISLYMNLTPQTVYGWINGTRFPDINNCYILAQLLNTTLDQLLVPNQSMYKALEEISSFPEHHFFIGYFKDTAGENCKQSVECAFLASVVM